MTVSITEFITARLEEDEAAATEAGGDEWTSDVHVWMVVDSTGDPVAYDEGRPTEEQAAHIARYDPARVLREVEAKREILDMHAEYARDNPHDCTRRGYSDRETYCWVIEQLAAAYSAHEDYNPDWSTA